MKQIRIRINNLIDQHKDGFYTCKGCPICTRIQLLSKELQRDSADKFRHILNKGSDMTKSDLAFLIDNDVNMKSIRKAVKMPNNEFYAMMRNLGLVQRRNKNEGEKNMAKITLEQYQDLKTNGLSDKEIAQNLEMNPQYLSQLKKKWSMDVIQPVTEEIKPSKCNCVKNDKTAEYEQLIQALRNDLKEAHNQCDEKDEKIRQLENVNAACEDVENETASLQEENESLKKLKYHNDYTIENQKYQLEKWAKEVEELQEENKALKFFAKKYLAVE